MKILLNMEIKDPAAPDDEIILVYPSGDGVTKDKFECSSRFDMIKKLLRAIKQERENGRKTLKDPATGA